MKSVYYIPNGTKNLKALFPAVDWDNVAEYYVETLDESSAVAVTSPLVEIERCDDDVVRIHFRSYLGPIDAMNFKKFSQEHEPKSGTYEKPATDVKSNHAIGRFGVTSNDITTCVAIVQEGQMRYYDELLDSPVAWVEWAGTEGQAADYLPIVISSKKSTKFKENDRFYYELVLEFTLSHERIIIRN